MTNFLTKYKRAMHLYDKEQELIEFDKSYFDSIKDKKIDDFDFSSPSDSDGVALKASIIDLWVSITEEDKKAFKMTSGGMLLFQWLKEGNDAIMADEIEQDRYM